MENVNFSAYDHAIIEKDNRTYHCRFCDKKLANKRQAFGSHVTQCKYCYDLFKQFVESRPLQPEIKEEDQGTKYSLTKPTC